MDAERPLHDMLHLPNSGNIVNATWVDDKSMVECASPPALRVDALPLASADFDVPFAVSMSCRSDHSPRRC